MMASDPVEQMSMGALKQMVLPDGNNQRIVGFGAAINQSRARNQAEKMGIPPSLIVDYKALSGDPSDNIPGVQGVGPKTSVSLLQAFGSLRGIYEALKHPDTLTPEQKTLLKEKLVQRLADGHESAIMSQKLATIDTDVPLNFKLDDCCVSGYDKAKITALFTKLGFKSLINSLPSDEFEQEVQEMLF